MSVQWPDWRTLAYGRDRERSSRWVRIAGGLLVVAGVTFAVSTIGFLLSPANPQRFPGILASYAFVAMFVVSIATVIGGVLAGAVHGYLNDGFFVSVALTVAPTVGLTIGYVTSNQIIYTVDPETWSGLEGGLYVFIIGGSMVLAVGILGFLFGAGARRLVERI